MKVLRRILVAIGFVSYFVVTLSLYFYVRKTSPFKSDSSNTSALSSTSSEPTVVNSQNGLLVHSKEPKDLRVGTESKSGNTKRTKPAAKTTVAIPISQNKSTVATVTCHSNAKAKKQSSWFSQMVNWTVPVFLDATHQTISNGSRQWWRVHYLNMTFYFCL
jgi:hypothetical protein